jgi:hypothetical protein
LRARVDNEIVVVDALVDDFITRSEFFSFMQQLEQRLIQRMDVQFEDLRGLVRLSSEAIGTLRESTERGFAEVRADHDQRFIVLHQAVAELGQKIGAADRLKP